MSEQVKLEKMKSTYYIIKLFLYIDDRKKLKLIKYNKKTQKLLDININNYKLFKRKYVVFNKNGIAKEYGIYDDKLIFEGEYLNGERNGKGKEYDYNGNLIFEGEFKRGKRWNGYVNSFDNEMLKNGKWYIKEYIN